MSDNISAWVDRDEMRRLAATLLAPASANSPQRYEIDFGNDFEGFAGEGSSGKAASTAPPASEALPSASQIAESPSDPEDNGELRSSALHSLKRAQQEGMAGGAIQPADQLKQEAGDSSPGPVAASKPPIASPFRRVNPIEQKPSAQPLPTAPRKLVRPPAPSGSEPILARVNEFGKWLKGPVAARQFFITNLEGKILVDEVRNPKLIQVARSLANAASDGQAGGLHVRVGEDTILEVVPTSSQFGTLILGLLMEESLPDDSVREIRLGLQEVADARLIRAQDGNQ